MKMIKWSNLMLIFGGVLTACGINNESKTKVDDSEKKSFYDFEVTTLDGDTFSFSDLKGKKVLIVNTASKCGFTPQYEQLQKLYNMYGGDDFEIVAFPSNDFGWQEPGSNEEIKAFCQKNYGVTFPVMTKIKVKGKNKHEIYEWLTEKDRNGVEDSNVSWNFQKYLIDADGQLVKVYKSKVSPMDSSIVSFVKS